MNYKIALIIILILLPFFRIDAKNAFNVTDSLKNQISVLKQMGQDLTNRQNYQTEQINSLTGLLDTGFDGVSSQLSASSIFIGICGILFAILSVLLGVYVTKIEKSIKSIRNDNELLLQESIKIKNDMESLSEKITKDSVGLYKIVRNEESNHMIGRLISVPEDISNLFNNLASRDLEEIHYPSFKEAFLHLKDTTFKSKYITLLYQHFAGVAIFDEDIKSDFIGGLNSSLNSAFKNDVVKSTRDIFKAILKIGLSNSKEEINNYIKAICQSKFSNDLEVYNSVDNVIKDRKLKFMLFEIIEKKLETLPFRIQYGKIILEYENSQLTPQESKTIEEIKNLNIQK